MCTGRQSVDLDLAFGKYRQTHAGKNLCESIQQTATDEIPSEAHQTSTSVRTYPKR